MTIDLEGDAKILPSDKGIREIQELAKRYFQVTETVDHLTSQLKLAKASQQNLEFVELPDAMDSVGVSEFTLVNGASISIVPFIDARISVANRDAAHAWLRANGHEGLVKHTVSFDITKGGDNYAAKLIAEAKAQGYTVTDKESVHTSTLKAWAKECLAEGIELPTDLIDMHVGRIAKIKGVK